MNQETEIQKQDEPLMALHWKELFP